jgi:RNA polymerase sigma-70 factor (ECF subfamily)
MTDRSLDELATAASTGGKREVHRLLDALRPVVARWAVVLTGNPDTAEDVTQSVLLRIHNFIGSYTPSGRFNPWAYRITRNVAADAARAEQRNQHGMDRFARESIAARLSDRTDTLELLSAVDELRRFMLSLSPQQRAALDLVELQGFSTAEAAEMLGVSPATLRVHIHRAKSAIRKGAYPKEDRRSHG